MDRGLVVDRSSETVRLRVEDELRALVWQMHSVWADIACMHVKEPTLQWISWIDRVNGGRRVIAMSMILRYGIQYREAGDGISQRHGKSVDEALFSSCGADPESREDLKNVKK